LSHPIPSIEFSPTNSSEDEGKLFVHSNPLEQVHIIYMSVTKLSQVDRLILLHLLGATDEIVVAVYGHWNVIMCKIVELVEGNKGLCRETTSDDASKMTISSTMGTMNHGLGGME
jgi:hypothetical protein